MSESSTPTRASARLDLLDYLRFAAAVMVVAYHYFVFGVQHGRIDVALTPVAEVAKYGYLGVDLFFLISGFVIMNSARGKGPSRFAVSRARRLLPAFWLAMLLTAGTVALFGDRIGISVTIKQVVVNLTMVPLLLGQQPVDGVYWTLLYEVLFYVAVFVMLALGLGRRIATLMPLWALGMAAVLVVAPGLSEVHYLGNYYAYFAVGAILAEVRYQRRVSLLQAAGLVAGVGVVLHWCLQVAREEQVLRRTSLEEWVVVAVVLLWIGVLASMLIPRVAAVRLPSARTVGALTYPLYLVHARLGYIAMSFVITEANKWAVYPVVFVAALALAWLVHRWEELPFWKGFFERTLGRLTAPLDRGVRRGSVAPERVAAAPSD